MENENTTQGLNTQPEGRENGEGKTFTQEEVNKIVSERLKKERAKAEPSEQDKRAGELDARENQLNCREYLTNKGYPAELLEIIGTENSDKFIERVEKLRAICPDMGMRRVVLAGGMRQGTGDTADNIADAFKRK